MAPISIRQSHSLAPPRLHKGPYTKPIETPARIDPIVFVELFAGTVGIFILSVLIWKTGDFIRSFTEYRVQAEGRSPQTRFAKTWYGWVTLETHKKNKLFFRKLFARLREHTAWESPRTDYQWIWWDPGQEALQARRRAQRRMGWLPKFLMSYESPPADAIWNPGPRAECHGVLLETLEPDQVLLAETVTNPVEENFNPLPQNSWKIFDKNEHSVLLAPPKAHRHGHSRFNACTSQERLEGIVWYDARNDIRSSTASLDGAGCSILKDTFVARRKMSQRRYSSRNECPSFLGQSDGPDCFRITEPLPVVLREAEASKHPSRCVYARRRRIWAAKMQVKAAKSVLHDLRASSGPPGTPITEMLADMISEQGISDSISGKRMKKSSQRSQCVKHPSGKLSLALQSSFARKGILVSPDKLANRRKPLFYTEPSRLNPTLEAPRDPANMCHSMHEPRAASDRRTVLDIWQGRESPHAKHPGHRPSQYLALEDSLASDELSDWELRLIDKLDRKLIWMFNETTPGQKPYQFTLLANHWLNRETWIVIDPVSRVSTDARRHRGDPRYNVPYPEPDLPSRPKYPDIMRKRAHMPRIDCWRAAINQRRRASGIRDAVRQVDLYEDSVEEPPDGHIDPACWILPKPPQGFEMSTKQKNAWYEGVAGWQEQLEDWQRVRRGFRLRKALFEGRVNRNRVKELATNVNRYCQRASLKVINRGVEENPPAT
ncbi:hypothetical protein N7520_006320 [Penicillium odoratum]|uniref:uncharacterized protein n=1 Tax=Penicillium odoratum TaxID=1167516 RepID=UPI00254800EA|nr:uncharacterized protein N7520_006320 [Penicillium odoratum]KAJ5759164.1 hypothetical protein N7520_006320 [Penicillium odoratum]